MECEQKIIHPEAVAHAQSRLPNKDVLRLTAELFKALGDPTRLTILAALASTKMCVCDLAAISGLSSSAISHQLRLLRQLNLVTFQKQGKVAYYQPADAHVQTLLHNALAHISDPAYR